MQFTKIYVIIVNAFGNVLVAQLDRVFGYEPKGRGFESLQARQKVKASTLVGAFTFCVDLKGIRTPRGQRAFRKRLIIVFSTVVRSPVPKCVAFGWTSRGNA